MAFGSGQVGEPRPVTSVPESPGERVTGCADLRSRTATDPHTDIFIMGDSAIHALAGSLGGCVAMVRERLPLRIMLTFGVDTDLVCALCY